MSAHPRPRQVTELGVEKQCRVCGEWWPDDREFWHANGRGQLNGVCIACTNERRPPRPSSKKAAARG